MLNTLCICLLVGILVGAFAPEWAKIGVFLVALVGSDLVQKASHSVHSAHGVHNVNGLDSAMSPWLIGVAGLAFGLWSWHFARKRGLDHLGKAELRTRWANVRRISKWGW